MAILASEKFIENVTDIIHKDTQQHENHIDLTVAEVHRVTGAGSLDFGGSEFNASDTEKLHPEKQKPDDDYGWWKLNQGTYRIILNETLATDTNGAGIISPHPHARQAGLISNTFIVSPSESGGKISIHISVPKAECNIKENARIATLHMFGG